MEHGVEFGRHLAGPTGPDQADVALPLHGLNRRVEMNGDPRLGADAAQFTHQVRVEAAQTAVAPLKDGDRGSGRRGHVGEFHGDVAAAHEADPPGQGLQVEEIVAGRDQVGAGKGEPARPRPGRDEDLVRLHEILAHPDLARSLEARC